MDHHQATFDRTHSGALRLAAAAGLGALVLSLGAPARSVPPQEVAQAGSGMGMGRSGPGRMGTQTMDQHFIVMMIPHHDGAIAMADLALTRARRPEIKELARSIKASQTQENAQMRTWYRQWFGGDVPSWTTAGDMGMGVMMASMAQTNSQHPQLRAMQQAMVKAQSREIEQMSQWYRSWYGTP